MKVVYVTHCARLAGAELALLRLLPALAGVEPYVIAGEHGPLVSRLEACGVPVEVLPLNPDTRELPREQVRASVHLFAPFLHAVAYAAKLSARLRELQPDLVHCNSLKASLYGGIAARFVGIPVVWHAREPFSANGFPPLARRLVAGLAATVPNAIVADTASGLRGFPTSRGQRFIVPSPIALAAFSAVPDLDRDRSHIVFAMIGRISPVKGQDIFLQAFARAFASGDARAVILGEPLFGEHVYERQLHELVDELGIGDRVTFRGFRDDVAAELHDVDVVVTASVVAEAFAQTVAEGLAAGRAVVAPAAGGPAEIIEDGVTGMLFKPGDVTGLAETLSALAAEGDLRVRLGRAARSRGAAFAPNVVAEQIMAMYERLVESGRRTPQRATRE